MFTLSLGEKAVDFNLKGTDGNNYSLKNFEKAPLLVLFFTCNHCPYVIASDEETRKLANKFPQIPFVGINSNSSHTYKEDSYEHMKLRMKEHKFPWVYLHDETQETARAYGALRTPHFYLFDEKRELIYCGRAVDTPRDPSKISTHDLEKAIEERLHGQTITTPLTNPIGCNVKWEGKEAHWMPSDACDLV
ncbi:MAG: hypothetical protein S4CHLAM45_03890 [Chlamydiales bacterium]|nr:hypothetical protein [Chlamydiales bacterium]MCH9619243.1 hypothetical protein [Chlamydiales bacterium]MCH9622505.1 hypothetical protein [Chlamydiales bacterium]